MGLDFILDWIFPLRCARCQIVVAHRTPLCAECEKTIITHHTFFCGTCHARIPRVARVCHKNTPFTLGAASDYHDDTIRTLIRLLKFQGVKNASIPLASLLARYWNTLPLSATSFSAIVPVPLHKERLRERGFNQAALIGRELGARLGIPCDESLLFRIRNTHHQSDLKDHSARKKNMENAFEARAISSQRIILLDDVTTSGATLFEAARALRHAGAQNIIALTVAKA